MTDVPPSKPGILPRGVGALAVVVGAVLCCLLVTAIGFAADFLFIKSHRRTPMSDAVALLRAAYSAERAHFGIHSRYEVAIDQVEFLPERGNRYLYAFSTEGELLEPGKKASGHVGLKPDSARFPGADIAAIEAGIPDALWDEVGITGTCPDCSITIVAAGNLDDDATIDVWSISTKDRTIDGTPVTAGTPWRHVDDSAK